IACWQAFNHVINYLPAFDVYLDATSSSSPFGVLPAQEYDKPVIRTTSYAGVQRIPSRADADSSEATSSMTIGADGAIQAHDHYRIRGGQANAFSHHFAQWQKSANFDNGADQIRRAIEGRGYKGSGVYDALAPMPTTTSDFEFGLRYSVEGFL